MTDPQNPADWLILARDRLEKADAIFERFGASWTGIELLHEAVERFLKAYLVHKGWTLIKTHDLSRLLVEACHFNGDFEAYAEMARSLTEQFWEQHYPGGDLDEVGQDYSTLRESTGQMIALIDRGIAEQNSD